jgi:mono/diheme cytochrome c family protein
MLKLLFALPSLLLFAFLPQQPAATPDAAPPVAAPAAAAPAAAPAAVPADAAKLTNPVTPTAESQSHAKMMYGIDCAFCHGEKGNGKGDLVADMQLKMKDFTDPATLKDKSDGELFYIIKNGDDKSKMPAEGPRAKDSDIWNLVIYIRTLSK